MGMQHVQLSWIHAVVAGAAATAAAKERILIRIVYMVESRVKQIQRRKEKLCRIPVRARSLLCA